MAKGISCCITWLTCLRHFHTNNLYRQSVYFKNSVSFSLSEGTTNEQKKTLPHQEVSRSHFLTQACVPLSRVEIIQMERMQRLHVCIRLYQSLFIFSA